MAWHTEQSKTVYSNPWISVREDQVIRPDGSSGIYGVIDVQSPAVFVVAVNDADEVALVTIDRYPNGKLSVEVPAGGSDGQDLLVAAQRELLEETGFVAAQWKRLGSMYALNGVSNAPEEVFLATGVSLFDDDDAERRLEGIEAVRWVPFCDVLTMIKAGEITDGETIAAIMYAAIELGRVR